jgi:L-alanine-DL-glutamate epimerase-like enolase superfamily enzyme
LRNPLMITRVRLFKGRLHYRPEIKLHTATSGLIDELKELYLLLEAGAEIVGFGGVRINVEYLTGLSASELECEIQSRVASLAWNSSAEETLDLVYSAVGWSTVARALFDQTLHDTIARQRREPLAELLGHAFQPNVQTNQTLFWNGDNEMRALAEEYVSRGFKDLKLRMGVGTFENDLRRMADLRHRFGDDIRLSADVNGRWSFENALANLAALAPLELEYIEQPLAPDDWDGLRRLAEVSPIPLMLDESIRSASDVDRVLDLPGMVMAHLKLLKLGGIRPLLAAAKRLKDGGVAVMVGQMNEGSAATAAAAHCALATGADRNELYGAYGIQDDPVPGLKYEHGFLWLPEGPGIALVPDFAKLTLLWEKSS